MSPSPSHLWTCCRCLRVRRPRGASRQHMPIALHLRPFTATAAVLRETPDASTKENPGETRTDVQDQEEQGAMSRRLSEMAEETMDTGSKSDRKLMQDMAFSEDLKKQLEERIAQTGSVPQNQKAASEVNMPSSAGKGTRDIAGADPWKGSETLHDAALRMLDDSHKRLRTPFRAPSIPQKVNLRPAPKKNVSAADRLANARDKTSIYAISQQNDMTEKEREKWRKELKDRFSPGARPMPTTLQGLTSLANERIEDAIARGQFKNIPRGKGTNVERDYNANSPFLDTTEYFMNKIIQKQDIVPPWIEKQQELVKAVASFRGRLRNDWRRHAARMISSSGGSVEDHVRRAKGYALAEDRVNPRVRKVENLSSISSDGSLTSITVEERIAAGVTTEDQQPEQEASSQDIEEVEIKITEQSAEAAAATVAAADAAPTSPLPSPDSSSISEETIITTSPAAETVSGDQTTGASSPSPPPPPPPPPTITAAPTVLPMPHPFRDATWEKAELAYHTLAVQELNALTRSYNLMAPKIAQKPYYTLQRELNRCFADVAPQLADEIRERSRRPVVKVAVNMHREGGVLERFGADQHRGHEGRIRDESGERAYGFKEFWKDLFSSNGGGRGRDKNVA